MSISLSFGLFAALILGFSGPDGGERRASPAPLGVLTTRMDCATCHPMTRALSHPVGVAGRSVSKLPQLPMGPGGTVDCITCHDVPSSKEQHVARGTGADLRLPVETLCSSCHSAPGKAGGALAHGLNLGRAHLSPGGGAEFSAAALDTESRGCLGCHDGSAAGSAKVRIGGESGRAIRLAGSRSAEHPIGVRYGGSRGLRQAAQFRPESQVPGAIRLFGGQLGCGSCHSVYSGNEGMRAVSEQQTGLCLSCHVK